MLPKDLHKASFRGVPFLAPSDETSEGRTTIDHRYPDSNFRYAEDNGGIPPKFAISAILCEPNLTGKLRSLRRALTAQGPGTLKHPWCGTQFVQVDGDYTISRDQKHAGYVELKIKFLVTGPPVFPSIVSGISAVVSGLAASAVAEIFNAFVAAYGSPFTSTRVNSGTLVDNLSTRSRQDVSDAAEEIATALAPVASASASGAIIAKQPGVIVESPALFADHMAVAIRAPLEISGDLGPAPATRTARQEASPTVPMAEISDGVLISTYRDLFEFGEDLSERSDAIVTTTLDRANRQVAMAILASTVQSAAFACLAEAVATATYLTADDVERAELMLTEKHESLQRQDLTATVRKALDEIYVAASAVLRDASVRLPRIVTVSASNTPASVLAYMIYEDRFAPDSIKRVADRAVTLVALNLAQPPTLFSGSVNAVVQD